MKRNRLILTLGSIVILSAILFNFGGCVASKINENLNDQALETSTADSKPNSGEARNLKNVNDGSITEFGVNLFKKCFVQNKNTLISPLSVLVALGMTENGADGNTLIQMENTLGLPMNELNVYLRDYVAGLPQGEKYSLNLANSIWFNEGFSVLDSFKAINTQYYNADIYTYPFNEETKDRINNWVKEKTKDMIPSILEEVPEGVVAYLINALAFEAEWDKKFNSESVESGVFHLSDGSKKKVDFMSSTENQYLKDENATGFIKYYSGGRYAFAALLPNEDIKIADYVATLDGSKLNEMLSSPIDAKVDILLPKFELDYNVEMQTVLAEMGMTDAFSPDAADFSKMSPTALKDKLHISRVIHKTFISVGEKGTKAAAVTAVEMKAECVIIKPEVQYKVYLDRPFVYMLIDCEKNIPFFIGTAVDLGK